MLEIESTTIPLAELVIGSPSWVAPAVVLGTLLTFLVVWNFIHARRSGLSPSVLGAAFKLIAIAMLAVCLVQPMRRAERPRPRANLLPILVDTSKSMDLRIGRTDGSWRDRIDTDLDVASPIVSSMSQSFETRFYGFDKRLARGSSVEELRRGALGSRLIGNLAELKERLAGRPVAGVLLMTDGNASDTVADLEPIPDFGFPIYPVLPKQVSGLNDLRISSTTVRQTNFEISPVTLAAQVSLDGTITGDVVARLTDVQTDAVVEEKPITIAAGETVTSVSFQFRPADVGLRFYRLDVFRESDREAFEDVQTLIDSNSSETTLVNNTRLIAVDRRTGPYRVLYVSGRPNWEFKFLRRAVSEDAEVELTGLIRMANKEPKFSFRDKEVSSTNPLFQGLGGDAEEVAEQYDEPVMIRVGIKETDELESGFPKTKDGLFPFDALILDDIEPEFFSQDQLEMVRQFVSARGGGLLLLGGQEMFRGRGFEDSFLGDLSPVYVSRNEPDGPSDHTLGLTREGMLQPWMRLRETASEEAKRLRSMPRFDSINAVGSLKPGAYQLAELTAEDGRRQPAVAVHRFGKGKVGAITVGDFWRWSIDPDPSHPDDAAQSWRQITRWLVGDVQKRTDLSVQADETEDGRVVLRIEALDESYDPAENPDVTVKITAPGQDALNLDAKPVGSVPGAFDVAYYGDSPGAYVATAEVRSEDGEVIGTPKTGWARQIAGSEFDRLGVNRELLQRIAKSSGGELIDESDLAVFSRRLESTKVPVTETWVFPIWHRGWVIALALGCLCAEWGLRRMRGLA